LLTEENAKTWLALAEKAARAAGDKLALRDESWWGTKSDHNRDVKVVADQKSEALIVGILTGDSPFPVLGEESGWQGGSKSGQLSWIVDPLDGSANYARKIPLCCVSIALVDNGKPILGVVYDFNSGDLYSGIVGQGAWLNTEPMTVSSVRERNKAILVTGLPVRRDFSPEAMAAFSQDMAEWQKVRMIGTAALALAYVAAGRADCYREENIMFWDVAAGCALVEAAGGQVSMSSGDLVEPKMVTAAAASLAGI